MTLKELSQLYYLNREIEMDQQRLEELRTKASASGSPNYDGMPKGFYCPFYKQENGIELIFANTAHDTQEE